MADDAEKNRRVVLDALRILVESGRETKEMKKDVDRFVAASTARQGMGKLLARISPDELINFLGFGATLA